MPKKEKLNVNDILEKLKGYLEKETDEKKKKEMIKMFPAIKKSFNRSEELINNSKFLLELLNSAESINKAAKMSIIQNNDISVNLMIKILSIMLAKMENDGFIKINL